MEVLLPVVIGCVFGIVILAKIVSGRKRRRIEHIKQRYSVQNRNTRSPNMERRAAARSHPHQAVGGHITPSVDLSQLEPPPEGVHIPGERPTIREMPEPILKHANDVLRTLTARKAILKGVVTMSQEPKELTKVVLRDPALAGQILKTVNSAFYGLRYPVGSVFRAVLLLGHLEVRNIIWRSCVGEALGPQTRPTSQSLDSVWQHSFATSRVAYALARSLNLPDPDEISTTALLHDIGKILVLKAQPFAGLALYGSPCFSDHDKLQQEQSQLNLSHATLGHEIARIWGLPRASCEAIALHHEPSYVQPEEVDSDPRTISLIYLADILCHNAAMQGSEPEPAKIYLPKDGWLKALGAHDGPEALCTDSVVRALSLHRPTVQAGSEAEIAVPV